MMVFEDNQYRLEVIDFNVLIVIDKQTLVEHKAHWGSGQPNSSSSLGMQTIMKVVKRFGVTSLLRGPKERL